MFELPSAPDVSSEDAPCASRSDTRETHSDVAPWIAAGVSRATWYRRSRKILASLPQENWNGPRWVVFQTFPQAERLATHELTREGYRTYLPFIADRRRDAVIKTMWHRILVCRFPGYGFVELGPRDPWLPVKETSGVSNILLSQGKPAPVPMGEVERHMADDEKLCDLARDVLPELAVGSVAKVEEGAFTGYSGVVLSCNGMVTKIDLPFLGRSVPTPFARSMVAPV